jgi:hypothetical protein
MSSQAAAQVAALRSEVEATVAEFYRLTGHLCRSMEIDQAITRGTDLKPIFTKIDEKYQNSLKEKAICASQINELTRLRTVLKLKHGEAVIPAIVRLLDVNQAALGEIERIKRDTSEQTRTIEQLRRYERETEEKLVGLKQWEYGPDAC